MKLFIFSLTLLFSLSGNAISCTNLLGANLRPMHDFLGPKGQKSFQFRLEGSFDENNLPIQISPDEAHLYSNLFAAFTLNAKKGILIFDLFYADQNHHQSFTFNISETSPSQKTLVLDGGRKVKVHFLNGKAILYISSTQRTLRGKVFRTETHKFIFSSSENRTTSLELQIITSDNPIYGASTKKFIFQEF